MTKDVLFSLMKSDGWKRKNNSWADYEMAKKMYGYEYGAWIASYLKV